MSLRDELEILDAEVLKSLPTDMRNRYLLEKKHLLTRFLTEKALQKGTQAPDVIFRDKDLQPVHLYDLLQQHHVVLSFFRGTWCPYCNLELVYLNKIKDQVEAKDALLIATSPELYRFTKETIKKNNINFPVFTDLGNKAANAFGLVFDLPPSFQKLYKEVNVHINKLNDDDSWTLPVPATFIISKDRTITSAYVKADYTQRMEPDDILEQLKLLQP
jgi:peroxiredoxin